MSMSLRLAGALVPDIWGFLPRLPSITIRLTNNISSMQDGRLEELKEQIENNGGQPPFMIDNGTILRAAPKKKMSKRRHRVKLYAPGDKKIQQLNNLVRCPACGHFKRSHFMCMHCFAEIKTFLKSLKRDNGLIKDAENPQTNLNEVDDRLIYPGKFLTEKERKLKAKEWVPKREEPLLFSSDQKVHKK